MQIFWKVAAAVALFATSPTQAEEQSFPSNSGQVFFNMPSGNVGCVYTPAGGVAHYQPTDGGPELACDRIEPTYLRFILAARGKARRYNNVGDTSCCDGSNIFRYGNTWSKGPFVCKSTQNGLTCTRVGGNGFFISRATTKVY